MQNYLIYRPRKLDVWIICILKKAKNLLKIKQKLVFLAYLLVLLASWSCIYFIAIYLAIGVAINSVVLMALEVAISLLK